MFRSRNRFARNNMGLLYKRWIWANTWSECIGLGSTMLVGFLVFSRVDNQNPIMAVSALLFAVIAGAALEGGLVGYAQGRVINGAVPAVRTWSWVWGTAAGAAAAWLMGMIPSTAFALTNEGATQSMEGPEGLAAIALAAGLGLVLGPVLSLPQVWVLRRAGVRAWSWIPANALAWAFGMVVVFTGAGAVPQSAGYVSIAGILVATCAFAGATVGIIHGAWLIRILRGHNDHKSMLSEDAFV